MVVIRTPTTFQFMFFTNNMIGWLWWGVCLLLQLDEVYDYTTQSKKIPMSEIITHYHYLVLMQTFTSTSGLWNSRNQEYVKTDSLPESPPWSHPKSCPRHCWTDFSLCRTPDLDTVHRTTQPLIGRSPEWAGSVWGRGFVPHMSRFDPRGVPSPSMIFSISIWGACA